GRPIGNAPPQLTPSYSTAQPRPPQGWCGKTPSKDQPYAPGGLKGGREGVPPAARTRVRSCVRLCHHLASVIVGVGCCSVSSEGRRLPMRWLHARWVRAVLSRS